MNIEFNNLSFSYRKKGAPALSNLSGAVAPGLHLLLGENGAGKTTLLHLIAGLLFPSSGTCTIDGCPTRFRLPSINSRLFFTGVNLQLPAATLAEMVRIHAQFYPRFSAELLAENLKAFGIGIADKLKSMSTGTLQKAKLAYALSLRTDILLLDEPANGLDIESKRTMSRLIASQLQPGQTIIVSTHVVSDLEHLFDGVIDLRLGHLLYARTLDEITSRIRFVQTDSLPADAIYAEQRIGRWHCILPNPDGEYSEPDFQLLYMAARHSRSAETLVALLNMPLYNNVDDEKR